MSDPARKKASYEDLYSIPENMTGEIINGELIVTPRPSRRHGFAASHLGARLITPYDFAEGGGPGGWIFILEPEIGLGENIVVPDLAGWRKERFPVDEPHNWISVAPDWICEILSPSTARYDRIRKMRIYGLHEVPYLWLIDPGDRTFEAFKLESGRWLKLAGFEENEKVRAEPFQEIEIDLGNLWID